MLECACDSGYVCLCVYAYESVSAIVRKCVNVCVFIECKTGREEEGKRGAKFK